MERVGEGASERASYACYYDSSSQLGLSLVYDASRPPSALRQAWKRKVCREVFNWLKSATSLLDATKSLTLNL